MKMLFGKKKKEEESEVDVDVDVNVGVEQEHEHDLALTYGYPETENGNEDSSTAESIPPPPPNLEGNEIVKQEHDEGLTDDGESIEANEYLVSAEKEEDPNGRKKLGLIALCFLSFIVLLSLSIKYGRVRSQNKKEASASAASSSLELEGSVEGTSAEKGSFESPIADDTEPPNADGTETPIAATEPPKATDLIVADEDITAIPEQDEEDGDVEQEPEPTDGVDQETVVPTVVDTTLLTSNESTGGTSAFHTCGNDDTDVFARCENGAGVVDLFFCLVNDVSDEFWEWTDTPATYAIPGRGWGWLREAAQREFVNLPDGTYTMQVKGNGDQILEEYPIISTTEFTISCE